MSVHSTGCSDGTSHFLSEHEVHGPSLFGAKMWRERVRERERERGRERGREEEWEREIDR